MKPATRMTVLCVEDELEQLEVRKLVLEGGGFEVFGARTSTEALELFRTREISVVVLDYWLSGTTGLVIAEQMKRLRPGIPILMLSGFPSLPGEGIGTVDAWFQKSRIEPEDLIEKVSDLIRRNQAKAADNRREIGSN